MENVILTNIDWYLPQLYEFLGDMGFTVIINKEGKVDKIVNKERVIS